jgi:CBS domain-containing protein
MTSPTVATLMRSDPLTIGPTDLLSVAQAVMEREGIRQLPVTDNGTLVGILTERNLREHMGYLDSTRVDGAMIEKALTIASTTPAIDAARTLLDRKINALPVVDDGRLVGIITRSDLLQLLIRLLERGSGS